MTTYRVLLGNGAVNVHASSFNVHEGMLSFYRKEEDKDEIRVAVFHSWVGVLEEEK